MELRDDGENRGSAEDGQRKGIERVEDGVDGRQTKGAEATEDGVERSSGEGEREGGGRRRKASGKGGRDRVGWLEWVMEENQKKPMVWACARQ